MAVMSASMTTKATVTKAAVMAAMTTKTTVTEAAVVTMVMAAKSKRDEWNPIPVTIRAAMVTVVVTAEVGFLDSASVLDGVLRENAW